MSSHSLVPIEAYLDSLLAYEPDAEYVDGEIEQRPMGEYDHSTWQQAIERWFLQYLQEWKIRVRVELRVRVSPTRYRVPDVVVFDRDHPIEQILTRPPIAVFEILSPEDRVSRILEKLSDYEQMGIPTVRIVDPGTKQIYAYQRGALHPLGDIVESLPDGRCSIDWMQVKALLD